jgi:hypothetical protein
MRFQSFAVMASLCFVGALAGCSSKPLDDDNSDAPTTQRKAELVNIYAREKPGTVTDLDFDPQRPGELWATLREPGEEQVCTESAHAGCRSLEGHVVIIKNPESATPVAQVKTDPNAWHFMRRPTAIAFGTNGFFATCGEARTANHTDEDVAYNGPALWASDPAIFGIQPAGKNGSHMDMLHLTPYGMGIAHERDNVYWVFNGEHGALDRYDFASPHEIGGEDHSDGKVRRYAVSLVRRTPNVPSHLVYDGASDYLYVADTGNRRIVRLETKTGTVGKQLSPFEPMLEAVEVDGATLTELVPPNVIQAPSGIALRAGKLFVSDNATSKIMVFALNGTLEREITTELPAGSLAGIAFDPRDGKLYVADLLAASVWRVDE